jgi:hypothetical protein
MGDRPLIKVDLTKPVTKLVETVAHGIGVLYEPYRIRRQAEAEAEAIEIKAEAEAGALVIRAKSEIKVRELAARAGERIAFRELRRQENIERITAKALPLLPNEVAEQPVDPDWTAHFFENCQDISDEQIQQLWARILAGEVSAPGTFSLRTLGIVKMLTKEDAGLFTRFCTYVWQTSEKLEAILYPPHNRRFAGEEYDVLLRLQWMGLLICQPKMLLKVGAPAEFTYWGTRYTLSHAEPTFVIRVGDAALTEAGRELTSVSGAIPDPVYRDKVLAWWRSQGIGITENPPAGHSPDH